MEQKKYWYAVQETREDDWSYGSHDQETAIDMLREQGHGLIAVIDGDVCECEIEFSDLF